jgi:hypothetical protein
MELHLRDLRESREEAGDEVRLGERDGGVGVLCERSRISRTLKTSGTNGI